MGTEAGLVGGPPGACPSATSGLSPCALPSCCAATSSSSRRGGGCLSASFSPHLLRLHTVGFLLTVFDGGWRVKIRLRCFVSFLPLTEKCGWGRGLEASSQERPGPSLLSLAHLEDRCSRPDGADCACPGGFNTQTCWAGKGVLFHPPWPPRAGGFTGNKPVVRVSLAPGPCLVCTPWYLCLGWTSALP